MRALTDRFLFPLVALGHLAEIRPSGVDKVSREDDLPARLCNYTDVYNNDEIRNDVEFMEATATAREIARLSMLRGDIAVTKDSETPDDIGVPALVTDDLDNVILGYHLALIRVDDDRIHPAFLYWVLQSKPLRSYFEVSARGVTRFGLRTEDLARAPVPLADADEQRRIAAYLVKETRRLDDLTEKSLAVQELLQERQPSWLGQILWPSEIAEELGSDPVAIDRLPPTISGHRLSRIKFVTQGRIAGGTPSRGDSQYWAGPHTVDQIPWVAIADMSSGGVVTETKEAVTPKAVANGLRVLPPGTTLYAMYASLGKVAELGIHAAFNQAILALVADTTQVKAPYLRLWLRYLEPFVKQNARSNTQDNLNAEQVGNLPIVVPSLTRQQEIIDRADHEWDRMQNLLMLLSKQREFVSERRQALITAAVTGQLDVTAAGRAA